MNVREGRWAVPCFLGLAYGLSWWPWLGRLDNPQAAVLLPFGPSVAALVMLDKAGRRALVRSLSVRGVGRFWGVLLLPLVIAAATVLTCLLLGAQLAPAGWTTAVAALALTPLTAVVAGPLGEELGWRGWLLPRLLRGRSAVSASVLVAVAWLLFHLPVIVTAPSAHGVPWALLLGAASVVLTWTQLASRGNVLVAVALHAVLNSTTGAAVQLFAPPDQALVWWLVALSWVAVAAALARGPLATASRGPSPVAPYPPTHIPGDLDVRHR